LSECAQSPEPADVSAHAEPDRSQVLWHEARLFGNPSRATTSYSSHFSL
jgi:hypothetical protein